jgi:trk system potassium uptake protein TrkH
MNLRFVGHLLAVVILVVGAGILVSAGVSAIYGDPDVLALLISAGISLVVGIPLHLATRPRGRTFIGPREGFLAVGAGWIVAMLFGAIPFLVYGVFGPVDALFESMSGFTTTGASVLTDYDQPHGIMFWRSLTHWFGGMGIIVLFIAVLRTLGSGAMRLFSAETPGPVPEKLTPRIRDTARNLWLIYAGLTLVEAIFLSAFGMDVFDAFCHSFATMATGGFSNLETSIAGFDSLAIELIIVVFMFVAGGNFALYYWVIRGQPSRLSKNPEFRTYALIMAAGVVIVAVSLLLAKSHFSIGHAFRESLFQVVSLQTTTGFVTADFNLWNPFAKMLLVLLMFVGGSAGSTAGGFKVARILVLGKSVRHELLRQLHPQAVLPLKIGGRIVPESIRANVLGYFVIYMLVAVVGALLVAMTNVDLVTAGTSVVATLNNIGPGLEAVGATMNYAFMDGFAKVVLIAMMVIGRLELFAILLPLTAAFWRR